MHLPFAFLFCLPILTGIGLSATTTQAPSQNFTKQCHRNASNPEFEKKPNISQTAYESAYNVRIYKQAMFRGTMQEFKSESCNNLATPVGIGSIKTHGTCIVLFTEPECKGRGILVQPGSPVHDNLREIELDQTQSIGPCYSDQWYVRTPEYDHKTKECLINECY